MAIIAAAVGASAAFSSLASPDNAVVAAASEIIILDNAMTLTAKALLCSFFSLFSFLFCFLSFYFFFRTVVSIAFDDCYLYSGDNTTSIEIGFAIDSYRFLFSSIIYSLAPLFDVSESVSW